MKCFAKSCRRYRTRISLLASGGLPEAERAEVERHAAGCRECRESLADAKTIVAELTRTRQARGEIEPSDAFHDRWVRAVQESGRRGRGAEHTLRARCSGFLSQLILPRPAAWASLAAAWVMILYFNLSCPKATTHAANAAPPTRSVTAYLEQRRELARLLDPSSSQAAPATTPVPRPRTQRQTSTMLG